MNHHRTPLAPRVVAPLGRRGYVMLVVLVLLALIGVIGATSLSIAGVDQRIANHNRKHMVVFNTSAAGTEHARNELETKNPLSEGLDTGIDSADDFVTAVAADTKFGGSTFNQNLGVYWVQATYERCSNPPPGYSTEVGKNGFRSDYWSMESTAKMVTDPYTMTAVNETEAVTIATIRKVVFGNCKVR